MQKIALFLIANIYWLISINCFAQNDSILPKTTTRKAVVCEIKMKDGLSYTGYILQQTDSVISLKSEGGVMVQIPKHNVKDIFYVKSHPIGDTLGGVTTYPAIIADKYYVAASNAFLFKPKVFYGSSNDLIFYNINYAVSQHISLGVSTGIILAPIAFHLKANYQVSHKLYIGFDGLYGSGSWLTYKSYGGGGLMKLTYGEYKKNVTVFAGYGDVNYYGIAGFPVGHYAGGGYSRSGGYTHTGGGGGYSHHHGGGFGGKRVGNVDHIYASIIAGAAVSLPISKKLYFVGEVFAFPEIGAYSVCPAIRTAGKKNISWVFGIEASYQANIGSNEFGVFRQPILPYIGFSFKL
jgi:hypothetical protein